MTILNKLNKCMDIRESVEMVSNAEDLISLIKSYVRRKVGNNFVKVVFDKANYNGSVFLKFSLCPWQKATNTDLKNSKINFIISISGFNPDGTCGEDNIYDVEMFNQKLCNRVRQLKHKRCYELDEAKKHVIKYFERYSHVFSEDGGGGGDGGGVFGAGTASGATSTGEGGEDRSEGDIAVFAPKLGAEPFGRPFKRTRTRRRK